MDKSSILKAFNKLFFEFLDDIISIYPTKEIKHAKDTFEMIKRANPTIIIKCWQKDVYEKYQEQINNRDISFFIEKDYKQDIVHNPNAQAHNPERILEMIDVVRVTIRDMEQANRNHCADYMMNLSKLGNIYTNLTK
jgi:hypothetical protein